MLIRKYPPADCLQKFVRHYWLMTGNLGANNLRTRDIPDGNIEVIINLGSPFKKVESANKTTDYREGSIKGQFDHSVMIEQSGNVRLIGICFYPWGLYHFVKQSLHELTNIAGPLDLMISPSLQDQLYHALQNEKWVGILNQALIDKIDPDQKVNPILTDAIQQITHTPTVRINEWHKHYGIDAKTFQRLFKKHVGLSPKQFARVTRMRNLVSTISKGQKVDWMKLVVDYDFYDRSHLCHEFQAITGTSPEQYHGLLDTFSEHYNAAS